MKSLLYLSFLLLNICLCFAQDSTKGIEYLYDPTESYTNTTILKSTGFTPLTETINNGIKNGVYWFKIAPEEVSNKKIVIANNHVLKGSLYLKKGNKLVKPSKKEHYLTFNVPEVFDTVYLKVTAERGAFIPIKIKDKTSFFNDKLSNNFINGLYYGFTLMLFVVNLIYFLNFKEITFFYYLFTLLVLTSVQGFYDGSFRFFLEDTSFFEEMGALNHYAMAICAYFFASAYLELDFYMPKNKYIGVFLLLLSLPFVIHYFIYKQYIYFLIIEILSYLVLGMYLFCGFYLYKESTFAKFFCLAYSMLFIAGVEHLIGTVTGAYVTNTNPLNIKIGGIIEMLLISFAVVYRMNSLKKENIVMREAIFEYVEKINTYKNSEILKVDEKEFSKQELSIIEGISMGLSNKEIAEKVELSINTVKYHIKKIYNKLQIDSRTEIQEKSIELV